jgi:hypothetical protein
MLSTDIIPSASNNFNTLWVLTKELGTNNNIIVALQPNNARLRSALSLEKVIRKDWIIR